MISNPPPAPVKKPNLGKRKIEIKKIENLSNLQVTFSKRRKGLFKKASELCITTGAEIAIIVQSVKKRKIHKFAQPDLKTITDRFIGENTEAIENNSETEASKYWQMCRELEAEKKRNRMIEAVDRAGPYIGDDELAKLDIEELEGYAKELDDMKESISLKVKSLVWKTSSSVITPKVEECEDVFFE